jgi:hypothetical protein
VIKQQKPSYVAFMADYDRFRTFKHGALHGFERIILALPIMGTNALFEKRSFNITGGFGSYVYNYGRIICLAINNL